MTSVPYSPFPIPRSLFPIPFLNAMFTSSNSGNNRLLALEQELMGWKISPKLQQEQHEQDESSMPDSEAETEEIAAQDSAIEETEELEEVGEAGQFSYAGLAEMLQNNANERFRRNVTQLQAKWDGLESLPEEEETVFEYPSRRDAFPSAPIRSDRDPVSAFEFSQLPELDLPKSDRSTPSLFDISLPKAEDYTPSPVSSSPFSSGEPSYASLLQVIQSARQSDRTPDESEATIDVESYAIAQEQAHSEPLPTYSSLAASIKQPLLPAARSTDALAKPFAKQSIALALEPIELEPISDEEEDDW
jgi:hypothetical protein